MRWALFVFSFTFCLGSSAQLGKQIDEDGNVVYVEDRGRDEAQSDLEHLQTQDDLSEIQRYLGQREAARKQQQKKSRTRSAVGLDRRRVDLNQRLNYRKCRDLKRWGLKCY